MADATVSSSITLLQTILTFSGALLAPIIGTAASLISRSPLQRRQQAIEYRVKQLERFDHRGRVLQADASAAGTAALRRRISGRRAAEFPDAIFLAAASADNLGMDCLNPVLH